jgi:tripartite-type tricarboxylate transporter receptor subunit TctC
MDRRQFLQFCGGSAVCALGAPAFADEAYPSRPIKLIVPFSAGGLVDLIGRLWGEAVRKSLGTIIVENDGGAGGVRGASLVARATPDGYTLLLGNTSTQILAPSVMANPPYETQKAFDPISMICVSSTCIAVASSLPVKNLKELIAYAKAHRGQMSYGTAGAGTTTNLAGEIFKKIAGLPEIVQVPYRGAGPGENDLMSGHIPMMTPNVTAHLLALHKSGKIRILAVNAPKRLTAAPDIPTAEEAGVPGLNVQVFTGVFAPIKTPDAVVKKVADACRMAMADQSFTQKLVASGFDVFSDSSPQFARTHVKAEAERLIPIIKEVGFTIN